MTATGGEELRNQVETLRAQNMELEAQVEMLRKELDRVTNSMEEKNKDFNPQKVEELESQIESMKIQMKEKDEECKMTKELAEEERQRVGKERNETEVERHKLQLDIEHWKGQTDQMEKQLMALRDILKYEKGAKMRLENRIRELESRSFGWSNGGNQKEKEGKEKGESNGPLDAYRNIQNRNHTSSRQDRNQVSQYQGRGGYRQSPEEKEDDMVFGKPSYSSKRERNPRHNAKRSNSPFAVDDQLNIYGKNQPKNDNFGEGPLNTTGGVFNSNNQRNDTNNNVEQSSRPNYKWGNARDWRNDPQKGNEESGNMDSIASKRMAVRKGRGSFEILLTV
jgi:hypothetical protein